MANRSYNKGACPYCRRRGIDRRISNSGGAIAAHMRWHVDRGEAIQKTAGVWIDPLDLPVDRLPYSYVKRFLPDLLNQTGTESPRTP
jgi:hypothetical protein